jgi:hypothetical protein
MADLLHEESQFISANLAPMFGKGKKILRQFSEITRRQKELISSKHQQPVQK